MGIEALVDFVERSGSVRASEIVAEARREAARIEREGRQRRESERRDALARREREWKEESARAVAGATERARALVLEARASLLDRVFAAARTDLPALLATPAYRDGLAARAERCLSYLPGARGTVEAAPALLPLLRGSLGPEASLEEAPDLATGLRARSPDGRVLVDDTLVSWLERLRPRLAAELLGRLARERARGASA